VPEDCALDGSVAVVPVDNGIEVDMVDPPTTVSLVLLLTSVDDADAVADASVGEDVALAYVSVGEDVAVADTSLGDEVAVADTSDDAEAAKEDS
jgi:hypothetical protein